RSNLPVRPQQTRSISSSLWQTYTGSPPSLFCQIVPNPEDTSATTPAVAKVFHPHVYRRPRKGRRRNRGPAFGMGLSLLKLGVGLSVASGLGRAQPSGVKRASVERGGLVFQV
ncbi:unnamed protein product, partial [Ectocarpus sp. 8 AP-2014]